MPLLVFPQGHQQQSPHDPIFHIFKPAMEKIIHYPEFVTSAILMPVVGVPAGAPTTAEYHNIPIYTYLRMQTF
jgi:hypothetical protein